MDNNIDQNLYAESMKMALRVDFLANSEELRLYATSIYNASIWSREVDKRNKTILKSDRSIKYKWRTCEHDQALVLPNLTRL